MPTFYTRLLADPRLTRERAANMRLFISGSAPLLVETHRQWEARTGHRILERYGMTETNMSCSNPYEGERRAGTVGFPLPGVEARIMVEGREAEVGEVGVLEVRGRNVFKGYWQMPEKTAEELRPDGWFITGDLASVDADGYVTIVGRAKDLIISGGFNVYPKEVEEVIDDMEGVVESAVIGVPHPDFGEGVVAVVVPSDPGLTEEAVMAGLAGRLAKFKQPKRVVLVDALPRNTMGKVQKKTLREQYAGGVFELSAAGGGRCPRRAMRDSPGVFRTRKKQDRQSTRDGSGSRRGRGFRRAGKALGVFHPGAGDLAFDPERGIGQRAGLGDHGGEIHGWSGDGARIVAEDPERAAGGR
ncbi:AMP-binding protein [Jhaorihella thermophila]